MWTWSILSLPEAQYTITKFDSGRRILVIRSALYVTVKLTEDTIHNELIKKLESILDSLSMLRTNNLYNLNIYL